VYSFTSNVALDDGLSFAKAKIQDQKLQSQLASEVDNTTPKTQEKR
jgi:hypothetical protein